MTDLFFWSFMLKMALLILVCMLYFGWRFLEKPSKNINSGYGCRSTRSMRSQDTCISSGMLETALIADLRRVRRP